MRALALLPLLFVAGCSEAPTQNNTTAAAEAPSPGQWEVSSEVTRFRAADQGAPRINTPLGTRATESVCVAPGDRLPSELFSGAGYDCSYPTYYVRNGRINLTLQCRKEGLSGDIPMTINGTFEAGSVSYERNMRTILSTDGDVEVDTRVTARRTGDCTPAPAGGNESADANQSAGR